MSEFETLSYNLEVRNLGPRGYEVVVAIVNEEEAVASVVGATVEILRDGVSDGFHRVAFPSHYEGEPIPLGQFEIAEGHFHLPPESRAHELRFKVQIDWRSGDEPHTKRISRHIETSRITRKG